MHQVLIVGAGLTGAVIARELAEQGVYCEVIDARSHIGGNCYTERDGDTGVMVHTYGPHIFHTANMEVWDWIRRFGEFRPYAHHVYANAKGRIYSLPINLHTLNQFFGATMSPAEAEAFVSEDLAEPILLGRELNFEEQAISLVGRELYGAFLKDTRKSSGGWLQPRCPVQS